MGILACTVIYHWYIIEKREHGMAPPIHPQDVSGAKWRNRPMHLN